MLFQMVYSKLNLLLVLIPKYSIFWRRLKNLAVLTTRLFCNEKKYLLNYVFSAKLLQSDIFRTNNAKRIEFMHDFWRWWLIFLQSDSFCKRLDFTKNFMFKTFFDWRVKNGSKKITKVHIDRVFVALHFGVFFVQVWYV